MGYLLMAMIFCHILDDFCLQSFWLADGKCKSWWQKNAPDQKYRHDYVAAIIAHGFSWSFMIHFPLAIYSHFQVTNLFVFSIIISGILHANIDNVKANFYKINLIQDQLLHLLQIIFTWALFIMK